MANNIGTLVGAPIRPFSTESVFAAAFADELRGGLHIVQTDASRNAIPSWYLQDGMLIAVLNSTEAGGQRAMYQYNSAADPSWGAFSSGGGSIPGVANGLQILGDGSIGLGGVLLGETFIDASDYDFYIGAGDFNDQTAKFGYFYISPIGAGFQSGIGTDLAEFYTGWEGDLVLSFTKTGIIKSSASTGIEYFADYSADFTNRSLIDKGYVNSQDTIRDASIIRIDGSINNLYANKLSWNGNTTNAIATYGNANTIDAESTLTFDGSALTLSKSIPSSNAKMRILHSDNTGVLSNVSLEMNVSGAGGQLIAAYPDAAVDSLWGVSKAGAAIHYATTNTTRFLFGTDGYAPMRFFTNQAERLQLSEDGSIYMYNLYNASTNDVLYYNSATGLVTRAAAPSGGSGVSSLTALLDVSIKDVSYGDVLVYDPSMLNDGKWRNVKPVDASLAFISNSSVGSASTHTVYFQNGYLEASVGSGGGVSQEYVDGSLATKANDASLNLYVKKAGDTMTGTLYNTNTGTSLDVSGNILVKTGTVYSAAENITGNLTVGGNLIQNASIAYKTSAYTATLDNINNIIEASGTFNVTLPNNMPTGYQTTVVNMGTGVITLNASTLYATDSSVRLRDRYAGAFAYHKGSGVWVAFGNLK